MKFDFVKIKNFCSVKSGIKRISRHAGKCQKVFIGTYSLTNCYPNTKRIQQFGLNIGQRSKECFTKEKSQMANKQIKRCSPSHVIREL